MFSYVPFGEPPEKHPSYTGPPKFPRNDCPARTCLTFFPRRRERAMPAGLVLLPYQPIPPVMGDWACRGHLTEPGGSTAGPRVSGEGHRLSAATSPALRSPGRLFGEKSGEYPAARRFFSGNSRSFPGQQVCRDVRPIKPVSNEACQEFIMPIWSLCCQGLRGQTYQKGAGNRPPREKDRLHHADRPSTNWKSAARGKDTQAYHKPTNSQRTLGLFRPGLPLGGSLSRHASDVP